MKKVTRFRRVVGVALLVATARNALFRFVPPPVLALSLFFLMPKPVSATTRTITNLDDSRAGYP